MARLPRLVIPGQVHHVIHRGNNRQPVVADPGDFAVLHGLLVEQSRQEKVAVHAWLLMDNHLHLLATPASGDGLSRLMQGAGRGYVRYFNARWGRSGTLWEGRFRCAVLQAELYLMDAMVHLDLHPVRAGLVDAPADYPWSSHRHYVGHAVDPLVTPHALAWQLGNTPFAREQAYAQRVQQGLAPDVQARIADSAMHGWPLGEPAFLADIQSRAERRVARGVPGRPRKTSS
jgi:putative transposase